MTEPPLPRRPRSEPYRHWYWGPCWGVRWLPDGRELTLLPLSRGTVQLGVSRDRKGFYEDSWYFDTLARGWDALVGWDGTGEPEGWSRHPSSGRRRPSGDAAQEYVQP
jgi:hypothetical protein